MAELATWLERASKSRNRRLPNLPNPQQQRTGSKSSKGCRRQRPHLLVGEGRTSSSRSREPQGVSKLTLHRAGLSSPYPAMAVSPISSLQKKEEKEEAAGGREGTPRQRPLTVPVVLSPPWPCCPGERTKNSKSNARRPLGICNHQPFPFLFFFSLLAAPLGCRGAAVVAGLYMDLSPVQLVRAQKGKESEVIRRARGWRRRRGELPVKREKRRGARACDVRSCELGTDDEE